MSTRPEKVMPTPADYLGARPVAEVPGPVGP